MSAVDAVSVSPARASPVIVGAPVAAVFDRPGPDTVAESELDSMRPSSVHTAPAAEQSVVADSDTVTSAADRGRTVMTQRWFCPCSARFAPVTRAFVACSASSRRTL